MTRKLFDEQMARLSVLRFPPATIDSHWDALKELPGEVLAEAVTHALKTREKFPVPAELRLDADHVAPLVVHGEPLPSQEHALAEPFSITVPEAGKVFSVTREWKYYHERCGDTGWASWWCGPVEQRPEHHADMEQARCERRGEHDPHEWVAKCACFDSNPALVRRRANAQRYAEQPQKVAS